MRSTPTKLNEQVVLSTENSTFHLLRLYEDWRKTEKTQSDFQNFIETYLDAVGQGRSPVRAGEEANKEEVNTAFFIIQKTIQALDMALETEAIEYLKEINAMMIDFTRYVENSKFDLINETMKNDGKKNIISLFQLIYTELKIENQAVASKIRLRFLTGFLDLSADVRDIYDRGLGREVRKERNKKKFYQRQEEDETSDIDDVL